MYESFSALRIYRELILSSTKAKEYNRVLESAVREHLEKEKEVLMCVASGSMSPLLIKGDAVVVRRTLIDDLAVGDVVVFAFDSHIFTHRIVRIFKNSSGSVKVRAKGDRSRFFDRSFSARSLIGVVSARDRRDRRIYFDTPYRKLCNRINAEISYYHGIFFYFLRRLRRRIKRNTLFALHYYDRRKRTAG